MLTDVLTDTGPLGIEVVAEPLTAARRAQTTADVAKKIEQQFSSPPLCEGGSAATLVPAPPSTAQEAAGAGFTRGQLVEVGSAREIVKTLDAEGKLDGVPFMPEMAVHCGRNFRVYRRADITCVEGHGLRRMEDTVFLEDVRCNGSAHDGCQRRCLIFWKEAWLKPADHSPLVADKETEREATTVLVKLPTREQNRYLCQSTALATATANLPGWNLYLHAAIPRRRTHRHAVATDRRSGPGEYVASPFRFQRDWRSYRSEVAVVQDQSGATARRMGQNKITG